MKFCNIRKRKFSVSAAVILLVMVFVLGGCAKENTPGAPSEESTVNHVSDEGTAPTHESETNSGNEENQTGEIQAQEQAVYEYTVEELSAKRGDNRIYGVIYIPQTENPLSEDGGKMPTVIYAHGYGVTHQNGIQYAEKLAAAGYVVYCFDFCGGGNGSQSDGSPLEMSIFTEQDDLEAVIDMVRELEYVDENSVFLFGASQGGLVSGITAAENKEKLRGLILLYPGFEIVEDAKALFPSAEDIPETYSMFGWMTVGRTYFEDLLDYDPYSVIGAYDKDVLLIHGDSDGIVPLSSSERALEVYPSAELKILPGAGHGLSGSSAEQAVQYMLEYLQEHK